MWLETSSISRNDRVLNFFKTLLWNWINLLLFNLSNQRLPDAIAEDKLNKPYRPIPSGLLSSTTARRALLYGIPSVVLTSYLLGAHEESIIMVGLTWMYNDLGGGDENFVLRNLIIAISFGIYNHGSSRIARGSAQTVGLDIAGQQWITVISMVVFTTMQIQDLQDVEGDKKRGRQTVMLVMGMRASRWCTASPILAWSFAIPYVMGAMTITVSSVLVFGLGAYTAWRVLHLTSKKEDNKSWKVWAVWLMVLYTLPLVATGRS